ncbi:MAG: hypothetical protein ACI8T1_001523 [Verrucomicrobiales bacterium]|jgi:hypothetical protein
MNINHLSIVGGFALLLAVFLPTASAQTGSQDISLVAGWNAVWLEVEPNYPAGDPQAGLPRAPEDVFPIGVVTVASPKPLVGLAEFFASDPTNVGTFNQAGWEQWHRPAGIGDDLVAVTGNRAYLIEANAPLQFSLEGEVRFSRPTWTPDRYNLVGFGINGTISFQDFFAPSRGAHPVGKIFSLAANGNWAVVGPGAPIGSDTAYWIFCSGQSDYMGPVALDFDLAISGALSFGGPEDAVTVDSGNDALVLDVEELVFSNLGATTAVPALELITADPGAGDLALHVVRPATDSLSYVRGNQIDSTPGDGQSAPLGETVASNSNAILTVGALRNWSTGSVGRTNVYRLTTGVPGGQFWLPVSAQNNSLQLPDDLLPDSVVDRVAGLWVGKVSINAVTSIVEIGAPIRPTAGSAPLRVLFHSDATGAVSLLSRVTIMQTKTADPAIAPETVLIVDQAKIPFFEGIQERDGKRVGVRIEAVSYDMPRRTDIVSQSSGAGDLVDMIVAESRDPSTTWASGAGLYQTRAAVTQTGIDSYLLFRAIRPPTLKESYALSLAVDGAIGAGKTVRTKGGTLTLDPFHRSNPFRHAFHQSNSRGPQITRELTIVFDAAQTIPDLLLGSYRETIKGLIKSDLTLTGKIELRRVSPVATLDAAP